MCHLSTSLQHSNKATWTHFLFLILLKMLFHFDYYPYTFWEKRSRDHSTDLNLDFPPHSWHSPVPFGVTFLHLHMLRASVLMCGRYLYVYGKSPFSFFCFKWERKFSIKFVGEKAWRSTLFWAPRTEWQAGTMLELVSSPSLSRRLFTFKLINIK